MPDKLSIAMQKDAIRIAEQRLGRRLPDELKNNINRGWSYMGLEGIIDKVRTIETGEIEPYLRNLGKLNFL